MSRRFAAALSEHPLATQAVGEVVGAVLDELGGAPDVAVLFVTGPHTGVVEDIAGAVRHLLEPQALIGATAVSIIGGAREVEEAPAVSLWAGRPGAITPVRLTAAPGDEWRFSGVDDLPETGILVLLADPFSFPVDDLLTELGVTHPDLRVVGGLASAARSRGGNRLLLDDAIHSDGAVGVVVDDGAESAIVVSQGCRPVGEPLIVTRSERSVIYELGGRPALDRLEELIAAASDHDRSLMARGLHAGVVIDERKLDFGRGDFLIRNVLGGNRSAGAVAIGDEVGVGATVQFQVRDADTADEDLRALLAGRRAEGALVFTCNGRGTHLFGAPDHDAAVVHEATDRAPTAGMFCAGEIGPVGDRNFLHGFTASVLLFGAARPGDEGFAPGV